LGRCRRAASFFVLGSKALNRRRNPNENSHDNEDKAREQVGLAATGGAIAYYVRLDVRRETRRNAGNLEIGFNSTMLASKASA
jgi:hypothetical protein